jgi:hypothetical protein
MEKDLCKAITDLLRIADGIYFQRLKDKAAQLGGTAQLGGKLNKIRKLSHNS